MKFFIVLAVVALATTGNCFPGANTKFDSNEDDVEVLPFGKHNHPLGVIDIDAGDFSDDDFPVFTQGWRDSFSAFMKRINDLVQNVRTQVTKDFEDKLKNGNTTSTVEIINGHKVIKNQTVYEDPHTYVKSVIFEVVPTDNDTTSGPSNPPTELDIETTKKGRDREPLEDSVENEVSALNEGENLNIETLDDNTPIQNYAYKVNNSENDIESFEIIEPESLKNVDFPNAYNPEFDNIETLESNEISVPDGIKYNVDDTSNDIESFESFKPIDMSKDTRVNYILKSRGYPVNPDAEMVSLDVPKLVVI